MTKRQALTGEPRGSIPVSPQGWPFILTLLFAAIVCFVLCWTVTGIICALLLLFCLNFFRDPERETPEGDLVICPADGKVIRAETRKDGSIRIDIFMNVFNVHVNRAPMTGTITAVDYIEGRFVNASFDSASQENERNRFQLEAENGAVITFTQISGLIARRIISYVKEGDHVQAGERIGMIRFGSRVDTLIPEGYTLNVKVGDHVVAGSTILAKSTADAQYEDELAGS
ncbi:MAG: phosphatidylserine decarboxylase family protein [Zetaproteobacteria bacterium CG_4_9_14_3_um_filter_49_83]|nr:MAG: phosphatidylserine decarboxylase [Zetaproteobacteria bacterium CG1_02_49_23]PIQ30033.1 MAG: phosphatidylserine decarboxylase family protein [Zetaproteobacteria bacterium CG17_big_fil_post_rev_8_21_14_2_50_50_13]PIV29225.1 MAG: phosphatidylserine decarboxylase family protein [Zetaproteobacteria bacterium CG02_land_8_20_14_3_00_50_9]PIY56019.1 MAG: phosphatidylserine decarboxylase family protein [Zetaproteobacteria bacterium CG_4_10_14_0_8_um_filter_49_80]PJA36304.1 MAG: phosphatidylserin